MLIDILGKLRTNNWLRESLPGADDRAVESMTNDELADLSLSSQTFRSARALDVIEYGRTVHAEMAAITDAARRGASVRNTTMYSTTFSCHDCAKHIVAAGIERPEARCPGRRHPPRGRSRAFGRRRTAVGRGSPRTAPAATQIRPLVTTPVIPNPSTI